MATSSSGTGRLLDNTDSRAYLRSALEQGRFALFCQPALALKDDTKYPVGEVLVRMNEEEQAMLPPGEFLAIMRELGLLLELDRWIARQVISRLVAGCAVQRLSINCSDEALRDPEFPAFIGHEISVAGARADALIFELPYESLDLASAHRFSEAVHGIGAAIALEDLPCDTTSFRAMGVLKADYIKVDGGIIRKLCTSDDAKSLVSAAVAAASTAGTRVIAESVEDLPTLAAVARLGVDFAQGFGIYPPAPLGSWR